VLLSGVGSPMDTDSIPNSPATSSGAATPKSKTIEEIYKKKSQLEHILLRPDTYIGSVEEEKKEMWIYDNEKIVKKEISLVPGLYKIVDEILVNAADNKVDISHDWIIPKLILTVHLDSRSKHVRNKSRGQP